MIRLLFLCTANSARSQMAEGFARARRLDGVELRSAGTRPEDKIHPMAIQVMDEAGISISTQSPKSLSRLSVSELDVVVTLCSSAAAECCLLLPGHPAQVDWNLPDPLAVEGSPAERLAAFRRTRDKIRQLVDDLCDRGYLKALAWAHGKANLILDSLSEGIIAHDMERRIIFFNQAAEVMTGYSRAEVLGNDCHKVFPGGFCGGKCAFTADAPSFDCVTYPLLSATRNGEGRQLEVSLHGIKSENGSMLGVLATLRDLTLQHQMARRLGEIESFAGIIGRDKKMLEIFDLIRSVADSSMPVLVQGASGTGKELVAAAIHSEGRRANRLFVPVNCGALPEGLLESELFGHVRGAFTGAIRDKKGRFELADGGTIFLDEIGDISPAMQVKLLRVLQEGKFERVGDARTIHADVRIISATNKDLKQEIAAGRFREDLYYRLCVVPIDLPPLHQRCGDIPLLVQHILKKISVKSDRQWSLSSPALDVVLSYQWPGNIRELQNALQFATVKCKGDVIEVSHLPPHIISGASGLPPRSTSSAEPAFASSVAYGSPRKRKLSAAAVEEALRRTGGNKAKAARLLGVGRATLYRFLANEQ